MKTLLAKKARIERVHTDANGLQIMGNTVKLTLLDKDDNVMAVWWGAEVLTEYVTQAVDPNYALKEGYEEIVLIDGLGLNANG